MAFVPVCISAVYNGETLAPDIKDWVKGAEAVAAEPEAKNPTATAATPAATAAPTTSPTTNPTLPAPPLPIMAALLVTASLGFVVGVVVEETEVVEEVLLVLLLVVLLVVVVLVLLVVVVLLQRLSHLSCF